MALEKQKVALPIVDGLDTKGDEKTILPTRFLELENVDFTNPGALQKRNGYAALSNKTLSGGRIATGSAITSLNDELLQYSDNRLYSFSEGEQAWEDKGEIRFCSAYSTQISADNEILKNPSFYSFGGVSCYAYEKQLQNITHNPSLGPDIYDVTNVVDIFIVDDVSKAVVAKHTIDGNFYGSLIGTPVIEGPKVGFVGSSFVVFYYIHISAGGPTGLTYSTIDFLNPKIIKHQITSGSSTTILSYSSTSYPKFRYDVTSFNSRCFISYANPDSTDVILRYIDSSLILSAAQSTGYIYNVYNISINKQGSYLRVLISSADGTQTRAYLYTFNLTSQVHASQSISAPAPVRAAQAGVRFFNFDTNFGIYSISGYEDPTDSTKTFMVWQSKNISTDAGYLMSGSIDSLGTFNLIANPMFPGAELQSKVATYGDYAYFFVSKNVNASQISSTTSTIKIVDTVNKPIRTLFLIKALVYNSEISAKFEVDTAVFVAGNYMNGLPNVSMEATGLRMAAASINGLQPVNATTLLAPSVVKVLNADFSQSLNYFDATQGESLYISGGLLKQYDGSTVVEQGFLDTPEPLKDIAAGDYYNASGTGGLTPGAKYFYVAVYKWTDRTGKIHRSAPSRAIETSVPNVAADYRVNLTFTPLYFTNKENVEIEIYRTTGNGTIFYKMSHVISTGSNSDYITGGYKNNKLLQSISVTDNVADVELVFSEPLYTTGGILENDSPEASDFIATYKSRLMLLLSDGYTLQYSKVTGIGDPVRFSSSFKIPLDNFGGRATAAIAMDDHFIIFKEGAIFALIGEGPNDLGQQDDYKVPYLITSDAGCIDPNSLVNNPNGIMFKSAKGIYMLKRNFTLQYIGDSVEKYNGERINSATLHPTLNQIRLITASGIALVYDYYSNRWSTYTNYRGLDSIAFRNEYYFIKADGLVMRETLGSYLDNGNFITMRIKSAWVQISGVQGFERFYKMLLLGTYYSAHKLRVAIAYNFNPYYQQSVYIDAGALLDTPTYGSGSYGTTTPYGGAFPLYQFEVQPKIQKCQSFQFELTDSKTTTDGASFSLSHIAAEVGIKKGPSPAGLGRSFGTK